MTVEHHRSDAGIEALILQLSQLSQLSLLDHALVDMSAAPVQARLGTPRGTVSFPAAFPADDEAAFQIDLANKCAHAAPAYVPLSCRDFTQRSGRGPLHSFLEGMPLLAASASGRLEAAPHVP